MKRTTRKQYEDFKKEFLSWQKKFGLFEWKVYFEWKDEGGYASILPDHDSMGVIVTMTKTVKDADWVDFYPKDSAKHEAIHLLTADLWYAGKCRYIRPDDLTMAWERVTVKLEKML